jgi:Prohead core protein serine protease
MKLITETIEEVRVLTETSEHEPKQYFIEGIFMQGDIKNRNGRIYPSTILEKEMMRYGEQFIKTKRALGELGHPDGPQINGDRVSHLITEMKRDGSNFVGKAKILGTPMGNIVKTFIDEGVKVGVSTRGLGSVKATKEGIMEVQNDFHLATVDIVTDPSGPNCFVNGIMENTDYYYDIVAGTWRAQQMIEQAVQEVKKEYKRTVRKVDEAYAARLFENFIRSLKN